VSFNGQVFDTKQLVDTQPAGAPHGATETHGKGVAFTGRRSVPRRVSTRTAFLFSTSTRVVKSIPARGSRPCRCRRKRERRPAFPLWGRAGRLDLATRAGKGCTPLHRTSSHEISPIHVLVQPAEAHAGARIP